MSTVPVEHAPEPPADVAVATVRRGPWAFVRATGAAGMASALVIVVATFVAVVGPVLAPDDPSFAQLSYSYVGPIGGHPLGFDGQGRDVLSRLLVGARTSMLGPMAVVIICVGVGTLLAVAAGGVRRRRLLGARHPVRVPRDPARDPRGDRVRRWARRGIPGARGRVHAVCGARPPRRGAARTQSAVR